MLPLRQNSVLEMVSLKDICANSYGNPQINTNITSSTPLQRCNNAGSYGSFIPLTNFALQKESWGGEVFCNQQQEVHSSYEDDDLFLPSSYRRSQITAKCNPAYLYEAQNLISETEYPSLCMQLINHERKNSKHFTQQRSQKLITKRNRRTVFNTQQILTLEKIFNKKPYVNREERQILKEMLNVTDRVIKVWFQNRRRLSGKREMEPAVNYNSDSSTEENGCHLPLDYVESKINEPDEFGYVTLDERAMKELITVVDSLLTDVDLVEPCEEFSVEIQSNIINYEPISPVSIHDDEDEGSCVPNWEPYEPEESLRRLFDIQALINK